MLTNIPSSKYISRYEDIQVFEYPGMRYSPEQLEPDWVFLDPFDDWDETQRKLDEFLVDMKLQGFTVHNIHTLSGQKYPTTTTTTSSSGGKEIMRTSPDVQLGSLPLLMLKNRVNAFWSGYELLADKQSKLGTQAIAKIDIKGSKDNASNTIESVRRISWRPKVYSVNNISYKSYNEYAISPDHNQKDLDLTAIRELTEALALYSVCLPNFIEYSAKFTSFENYVSDVDYFLKALQEFNQLEIVDIENSLDILGLKPTNEDPRLQVLEYTLLNSSESGMSLQSFMDRVNTRKQQGKPQQGAVQMAKTSGKNLLLQKMKEGTVTGALGAVNRKAVQTGIEALGDKCPDILKTDAAQTLISGAIPALIILLNDFPGIAEKLPPQMRETIVKAAELMFDDFTRNAAGKVTEEVFNLAVPLLTEYYKAGQQLALQEETIPDDLLGSQTMVQERLMAMDKQL